MAVRPPRTLTSRFNGDLCASVLEHELLAERAATLGRVARQAEQALGALGRCSDPADGADRQSLVRTAAEAVWRLTIQRELCGYRDPSSVAADFAVPAEVMSRLGAH